MPISDTLSARLLIVDDEPANVRLLERLLERAGYTDIHATTDPREALPLADAIAPDLILLDLRMPHMSGIEVLKALRKSAASDVYLPVLVLTADVTRAALHDALHAGAQDFLTKPFDPDEVLLRIRNLLETRALHRELAMQNRTLEDRVRVRTEDEHRARERAEDLARRLVEVQESERREIARELHDQIGQMLTGLRMTLRGCLTADPPGPRSRIEDADGLARELLERVRGLALDLRPAMLDDFGLLEALAWHAEQYQTRTGIRVVMRHAGLEERLPSATASAAYRIVQEALTNVARHAAVDTVEVGLWVTGGMLMVQIEDRGAGFDAEATLARGATGGLASMRERATLLGGSLRISSSPGDSTTVTATLPVTASRPTEARSR
jgi:signal transduction histidine kinase